MEQEADLAQARVFVELLTLRARTLARDIESAHRRDPAARHELFSELRVVRGYIDRLHRRFPEIAGPQAHRELAGVRGARPTLG